MKPREIPARYHAEPGQCNNRTPSRTAQRTATVRGGTPQPLRLVNFHRLTLSLDSILDSIPHILVPSQPPRTPVARPTFSIRLVNAEAVRVAAGIRLERMHDFLRTIAGFHDCMHVIRPHVSRPETPATMRTDFANGFEYFRTTVAIQGIGRLVHLFAFHRYTLWTGFRQARSQHVVLTVHGAGYFAVQVGSVAHESN
jgi:hypothetical protein